MLASWRTEMAHDVDDYNHGNYNQTDDKCDVESVQSLGTGFWRMIKSIW